MNWYKKAQLIKIAATKYLYHGTGIQNLSTILSEGLKADADKLYDNEIEHGSIQTYGGAYLTDNIMTALSSAGKSSDLSDSKDTCLVTVKIEDSTPHIVLDEDNFHSPAFAIAGANTYDICATNWSPDNLAYFILNSLPSMIDDITNNYLQNFKKMRHEDSDQRIFDALIPYAKNVIETYCYSSLAAQVNNYFQGTLEYKKKYFEEKYPQFIGIDEATAASEYRSAHDTLIQKSHRLTSDMESQFSANVRSMENISYRGKNKIVMVSSISEKGLKSKYYTEADVLYLSDNSCLDQFINDITERLGRSLIVRYNNNVLYDNPRERFESPVEEKAASGNWYKKAEQQTADDIAKKWRQEGITLYVFEDGDKVILDSIIVPPERRKQGIGTQIMQELTNYADSVGKRIELSPGQKDDYHGTTSKNRLVNFYKRFGLIQNKGRNKDFTTNKTMYRDPNELV